MKLKIIGNYINLFCFSEYWWMSFIKTCFNWGFEGFNLIKNDYKLRIREKLRKSKCVGFGLIGSIDLVRGRRKVGLVDQPKATPKVSRSVIPWPIQLNWTTKPMTQRGVVQQHEMSINQKMTWHVSTISITIGPTSNRGCHAHNTPTELSCTRRGQRDELCEAMQNNEPGVPAWCVRLAHMKGKH